MNKNKLYQVENYLTSEQKTRYILVKEAFHNHQIHYKDLNEEWKTKEILIDLLNNQYIWKGYLEEKKIIGMEELPKELLNDREIIKSCLSYGHNMLYLKKLNQPWIYDTELQTLALKTYLNYEIIEYSLENPAMLLELFNQLSLMEKSTQSNVLIYEQTKKIKEETFENNEILKAYLRIKNLEASHICRSAINIIEKKSINEIVLLIQINSEIYKVLNEELKNRWQLIYPYYKITKNTISMPLKIIEEINRLEKTYEYKIQKIEKYALNEKLTHQMPEKNKVKKTKI